MANHMATHNNTRESNAGGLVKAGLIGTAIGAAVGAAAVAMSDKDTREKTLKKAKRIVLLFIFQDRMP